MSSQFFRQEPLPQSAGSKASATVTVFASPASWIESDAVALRRGRGRAKHTVEELRRTPVGSLVVCGDRQLLFEEAPTAYKRIEQVVGDLVDHGLATPVATTVPLVTYKTPDFGPTHSREHRDHRRRRGRS